MTYPPRKTKFQVMAVEFKLFKFSSGYLFPCTGGNDGVKASRDIYGHFSNPTDWVLLILTRTSGFGSIRQWDWRREKWRGMWCNWLLIGMLLQYWFPMLLISICSYVVKIIFTVFDALNYHHFLPLRYSYSEHQWPPLALHNKTHIFLFSFWS